MRHVLEPLSGEGAVRPSYVKSEVSVITAGQMREVGSVLQLIGDVEDSPKLFGEGFLFEEVRIFKETVTILPSKTETGNGALQRAAM